MHDQFMNYEYIFNYVMYSNNSSSNCSKSSYDPQVTSFHSLFDPFPSYEFHNIVSKLEFLFCELFQLGTYS